jgi:hypothetical protein
MKASILKKELASYVLEENRFGKGMEKELVEGFLKRLQINNAGIEENESPDFIINLANNKTIGLEFTLYYNDSKFYGSNGRALFEKWAKIAEVLREKFLQHKDGLEYWYGAIHFKRNKWKLADLDINKFSDEIFDFCIQNIKQHKEKCFNFSDFRKWPYINRFVKQIHFHNTFPAKGILWWHASLKSGSVPSPIHLLHKIIENKNKTAQKNYKWDKIDYRVLVICARALSLWDSGILLEDDLTKIKKIKQSVFDIIFYWDKFLENIFEIYPKQRIIFDGGKKSIYISKIPTDFII